jgi:hypothetical protein
MVKKPKSKNVGKGKSGSDLLSRPDFLKTAGLAAAGIGAAAVGMSGIGKAQETSPYTPEEEYKTLAALVDTYVPGIKGEPVTIFYIDDTQNPPFVFDVMTNLGAIGTDTPGAAFLPTYPEDGVMYSVFPCYLYLGEALLSFGITVQEVVSMLDSLTDVFNPGKRFYELPYEDDFQDGDKVGWGRYHIMYMMEKPDLLVPLLMTYYVSQGHPPEVAAYLAADKAAAATNIFRQAGYYTYSIYFSETCNIFPSESASEIPLPPPIGMNLLLPPYSYSRVEKSDPYGEIKYAWNIIPGSIWDQSGFPGPSYKNPDFASDYEGLKVKISDGKVNFIQ